MASVRSLDNAFGIDPNGYGYNTNARKGVILRNLVEGADLVMSHITHFYHLAALDYINTDYSDCPISGVPPWSPKDNDTATMVPTAGGTTGDTATTLILHYVQALNIRRKAHEMAALISGKQPCQPMLLPGGVTSVVTTALTSNFNTLIGDPDASIGDSWITAANSGKNILSFINYVYQPDILLVAPIISGFTKASSTQGGSGVAKYLAYGTFPNHSTGTLYISSGFLDATSGVVSPGWTLSTFNQGNIAEHIKYSYYDEGGGANTQLHPSVGVTKPQYGKSGAYTWAKAPRYNGNVAEVGPLARVLINYASAALHGNTNVTVWKDTVDYVMNALGLNNPSILANIPELRSVLGRHAARFIEAKVIATAMTGWLRDIHSQPLTGGTYTHTPIPSGANNSGYGLTEAPRGALGHWIRIAGRRIANYQCVVPTTWNVSPKDDSGVNGPIEKALIGTPIDTGASSAAINRLRVGRIIRSFDPCIACTVHIVTPDRKTIDKFEVSPLPER